MEWERGALMSKGSSRLGPWPLPMTQRGGTGPWSPHPWPPLTLTVETRVRYIHLVLLHLQQESRRLPFSRMLQMFPLQRGTSIGSELPPPAVLNQERNPKAREKLYPSPACQKQTPCQLSCPGNQGVWGEAPDLWASLFLGGKLRAHL